MKKVRLINQKSFKPKISTIICMIVLLVCFFTYQMFKSFNQSVTPKLIEIATRNIDKFMFNILNNYSLLSELEDSNVDNLLEITQNKDSEIISVNYDMKNAYKIANMLAERMKKDYNAIENGKLNIEYFDEELSSGTDGFVVSLPMGLASNQILLSNLGPRIPVKIKFIGTILTNLKTKITDYGINNALIELYMDVSIGHEIITPVTFNNKELNYEILIDARIINGSVPSYYGGLYETKSNILNIPVT